MWGGVGLGGVAQRGHSLGHSLGHSGGTAGALSPHTHHAVLLDHIQAQLLLGDEHLRAKWNQLDQLIVGIHLAQLLGKGLGSSLGSNTCSRYWPNCQHLELPGSTDLLTWLASGTIFCANRLTRSLKVAENSRICGGRWKGGRRIKPVMVGRAASAQHGSQSSTTSEARTKPMCCAATERRSHSRQAQRQHQPPDPIGRPPCLCLRGGYLWRLPLSGLLCAKAHAAPAHLDLRIGRLLTRQPSG